MERECDKCKKIKKDVRYSEKSEIFICNGCYRKHFWKRELIKCPRCERMKPHHGKGLCAGCYNSTFHIDKVKLHNAKRYHNIEPELYKKLTEKCISCDFNKIVELHHLDHNHKNNSECNLVGLCPNCHKLLHSKKYQNEVFNVLRIKGFKVPEGNKIDGFSSLVKARPA